MCKLRHSKETITMNTIHFKEKQRFPSCMNVFMFVILLAVVYIWYRKYNFDINYIYLIFGIIPVALMNVVFLLAGLKVEIDEGSIYYNFTPFQWKMKKIVKEDIDYLYLKKYDPKKDHLGYGITFKKDGKAFTLKGTDGLFIRFKDETFILLGTQKPKEMQDVIDKHFSELIQK